MSLYKCENMFLSYSGVFRLFGFITNKRGKS